jgi:ureidoacrylate peracid hydrolase
LRDGFLASSGRFLESKVARVVHKIGISQQIIERAIRKRGRLHWFDQLDPARTAHIIIDMQNVFVAEGALVEVPTARSIVSNINAVNNELRKLGTAVVWVTHLNQMRDGKTDWDIYYRYQHHSGEAAARASNFQPGHPGARIYDGLVTTPQDFVVVKNRYSAFIPGSSSLERLLRSNNIENIIISGTKTNVCCESTARDGMMLDFKVTMLSDCNATDTDEEHRGTLENMVLQFGDVRTGDEIVRLLASYNKSGR